MFLNAIDGRIGREKQRVFLEETYMKEYQSYMLCPLETLSLTISKLITFILQVAISVTVFADTVLQK